MSSRTIGMFQTIIVARLNGMLTNQPSAITSPKIASRPKVNVALTARLKLATDLVIFFRGVSKDTL